MPERSFFEQLDEMIDGLLSQPSSEPIESHDDLAAMARIAADLRDLPSPGFKARLKAELQRRTTMPATALSYVREGFHCVTPYVVAGQGAELIDFVKKAFGAEEKFRGTGGAGGIHCELRMGDSMLMMGGGGAYTGPVNPAALHYFVENPDEVYQRALQAGATSLVAPMDTQHGERFSCVKDAFGNQWYIARRLEGSYVPEGMHSVNLYFNPVGSMGFIEFLEKAFSADRVELHQDPEGVVKHAKMRIGDSVVEIGEAHSWWQPLATMIYLYVPNVDEAYQRALAAGGTSVMEPADQPYGDRNAGVKDAFGHTWYVSSPIR
jgi:uncharacterized glyoxalase superfamily protein PhnB